MSTISNETITTGITLATSGSYASPLTITTSGAVEVSSGNAIYGPASNAWLVENQGTIAVTGTAGYGVVLYAGGSVGNNAGLIEGPGGVGITGGAGTVTNSGTIIDTAFYGVDLYAGGSLGNNAGLIEGRAGVLIANTAGMVTNSGTIAATGTAGYGVVLTAGGSLGNNAGLIEGAGGVLFANTAGMVTNSGTIAATGTAGYGVVLTAGGTVIDSGTISGASGTAVSFGGTGGNLLALQHGYDLNGAVVGSASATNTVELAGSVGAAVTVGYNGLGLSNVPDVLFGAGGNNTLTVANIGGTLPVTISGFTLTSDIVDLTAVGTDGTIASQSATQVTITGSSGSETLQLDTSDAAAFTTASDGAAGTELIACYLRGTRILAETGEVPVEELAIGDKVVTISGAARPIKWIGQRSYAGRFALGQKQILPICVTAGTLADGVPRRDLWVSPNHALYLEAVLIEARDLINGVSIFPAERVEAIEYFHIELDSHDVIVAEGAAAESFTDDDSRGLFHNVDEYRALYPGAAAGPTRYCAPRRDQGYEVERARATIALRAGLAATAEMPPLGMLRGQIDEVRRRWICGWAQDTAHPEAPVCLDILAGGELVGQVVANRYRGDLAAAGLGSGRHSFEFVPPPGLAFTARSIQVRRSLDGTSLTCSGVLKQSAARRPRFAPAR